MDMPAAWLSLDPSDDDPTQFFLYLIAALRTINSILGQEIKTVIKTGQIPPYNIISTSIINQIAEMKNHFLLVLDDVHLIQDPIIFKVLESLLVNLTNSLHMVFITRENPPLPRLQAYRREQKSIPQG